MAAPGAVAALAPSITQSVYQALQMAKTIVKGVSRPASATASSRRRRASSKNPRQASVRGR